MSIEPIRIGVPQWTLGDRLRRVRRSAGMTQGEFSALLQVGAKGYAAWEADRTTPSDAVHTRANDPACLLALRSVGMSRLRHAE